MSTQDRDGLDAAFQRRERLRKAAEEKRLAVAEGCASRMFVASLNKEVQCQALQRERSNATKARTRQVDDRRAAIQKQCFETLNAVEMKLQLASTDSSTGKPIGAAIPKTNVNHGLRQSAMPPPLLPLYLTRHPVYSPTQQLMNSPRGNTLPPVKLSQKGLDEAGRRMMNEAASRVLALKAH